jgi:AraC-like DNA-binding protein
MQFVQLVTSFLAISQLVFTGLYFFSFHRAQALGKLYGLYCVCLIAYILDNLPQLDGLPILNHIASLFAILAPGIFWVIGRYYFEDEPRFSGWILLLIPFYTILRLTGVVADDIDFNPDGWMVFIFFILPNIIMLALCCHVIYMAIRGRRVDLVEERRWVRLPLAIFMGLFLLAVITTEILLLPNSHVNNAFFLLLFVFNLIFNLRLTRHENPWLELSPPEAVIDNIPGHDKDDLEPVDPDGQIISRIEEIMADGHYYRRMGLTIPELALALKVSEHRLRRVINRRLHYRNFNQFLNHYRIKEASIRLLSPEEARLPILTIAMDVGYRSLSSFNKAFLATHQVTPTQFRQKT